MKGGFEQRLFVFYFSISFRFLHRSVFFLPFAGTRAKGKEKGLLLLLLLFAGDGQSEKNKDEEKRGRTFFSPTLASGQFACLCLISEEEETIVALARGEKTASFPPTSFSLSRDVVSFTHVTLSSFLLPSLTFTRAPNNSLSSFFLGILLIVPLSLFPNFTSSWNYRLETQDDLLSLSLFLSPSWLFRRRLPRGN